MRRERELESAVMRHLWACDGPVALHEMTSEVRRPVSRTGMRRAVARLCGRGFLRRVGDTDLYEATGSPALHVERLLRDAVERGPEPFFVHFIPEESGDGRRQGQP